MRIAVTGSAGLIGQAVVAKAIAEGHSVIGIDWALSDTRPGSAEPGTAPVPHERRHADVTDYEQLVDAVADCEALIHLAAHPNALRKPDHTVHNNNVVASYNALRAAAELEIDRVCVASSVNAVTGEFNQAPRYVRLPVDESHPAAPEDSYGLSKLLAEAQADAVARRHPRMTISTLRFHWVVPDREYAASRASPEAGWKQLWGYTTYDAAARACLCALSAAFTGHERFYIVAPDTVLEIPSAELARRFHPDVPMPHPIVGNDSFFDCGKAERLLGWRHDKAGE